MFRRRTVKVLAGGLVSVGLLGGGLLATSVPVGAGGSGGGAGRVKHIVVIYQENHSFDNLYGLWGSVNGQPVNGVPQADLGHTVQVAQDGTAYTCLLQNDVNLTAPSPLSTQCIDPKPAVGSSHFINLPFNIDTYIPATATTCPPPGVFAAHGVLNGTGLPGGCTADLVHRFYQEQYQLDGGKQDRYVTGSDAVGLAMGYYDTTLLPIYQYLHSPGAPRLRDRRQLLPGRLRWFVPQPSGAGRGTSTGLRQRRQERDRPGNPANGCAHGYGQLRPALRRGRERLPEQQLPALQAGERRGRRPAHGGNRLQRRVQPQLPDRSGGRAARNVVRRLRGQHHPAVHPAVRSWHGRGPASSVADEPQHRRPAVGQGRQLGVVLGRLGQRGWQQWPRREAPARPGLDERPHRHSTGTCAPPADQTIANGAVFPNCPDALFQFHHQPFGYFANYADGTQGRVDHLKDEQQFLLDAQQGKLPSVSFVKPIGEENEHPGYTSESTGSQHLVDLIKTVLNGPNGKDTMIVVTYDEFGGQWDHVPVPGTNGQPGPHDVVGPGTRVPALVISRFSARPGSTINQYDTTSILATIEQLFSVKPLTDAVTGRPTRDAAVQSLLGVFRI